MAAPRCQSRANEAAVSNMALHIEITPQRLRWDHFREVSTAPVPGAAAQTAIEMQFSRIRLGSEGAQRKLESFALAVRLDRQNCWVVRGRANAALLDHERLHLRLAIVVARELERELLALRADSIPSLQVAIDRLRSDKAARVQAISDTYDSETEHGRLNEEQSHWRVRVAGWESARQADL